jgi:hypothetical protein
MIVLNAYAFSTQQVNSYGLVGVSSSAGDATGAGTISINVPYPSGLAANDIAVVHIFALEQLSYGGYGTLPTGWALYAQHGVNGTYQHFMFWKRLDGSESGNFTLAITLGGANSIRLGMMSVWGGCVLSGDPFDGKVNNEGSSASCASASLTTTQANEIVVNMVAQDVASTFTPPSGYTEGYDANHSATVNGAITLNYKTIVSAGSVTSTTTVGTSSGRFGVISFGLIKNIGTPTFSVHPIITTNTGFFAEGDIATVAYTHNGTSTAIQWTRDGADIVGATSANYTYDAADVGAIVTARVKASIGGFDTTETAAGTLIGTPTYSTEDRVTDSADQRVTDSGDVRVTTERIV